MFVGIEFLAEPAGIEDQVVTFRLPALEFDPRAIVDPGDIEHLRVDVPRARTFL